MTSPHPPETVDAVIALLAELEHLILELRRGLNDETPQERHDG